MKSPLEVIPGVSGLLLAGRGDYVRSDLGKLQCQEQREVLRF